MQCVRVCGHVCVCTDMSMLKGEWGSQCGHKSDFCPFSDSYQSILCFQKHDFSILEEYATDFFTPTLFQDKTLIATTLRLLSML